MTDISAPTSVPTVAPPDITRMPNANMTAAPWHQTVPPEIKTVWHNKGYDLSDPVKVAEAATRGYVEASKYLGVPPNQLLRLPSDVNDEAGWNAVYQRFGAPNDKAGYDFSKVKFSDGRELDQSFVDFMREKAYELHLPTTSAAALSQALVGFMEQADKQEADQMASQLAEQKAQLQKDWGNNYEFNRQTAAAGAQKLNVTPQIVDALEKVVGYAGVMEMFRKVGAGSVEDSYIQGHQGGDIVPAARTAKARLDQLTANAEWRQRLNNGDQEAFAEMTALNKVIAGYVEEGI